MILSYIRNMKVMSSSLSSKKCEPCEEGTQPLSKEEVEKYLKQLSNNWEVVLDNGEEEVYGSNRMIKREFEFDDFKKAMKFVDNIADLAESEGHHPNIHIYYNRVVLELTTHSIEGLSKNDFIVAVKVDNLN